jgi:putative tryptophan/tyrosine transport system substrate-binding protein
MRRRQFIAALGSAAAGWLFTAGAQQNEPMRRIGVLIAYSHDDAESQSYVSAFRDALKEFGWVEGRNFSMIEYWTGPESAPIEQAAIDLIKQEPDVILSSSTPTTAALLRQTLTIPIVFAIVSDPIGSGFVKTFANPGGNATGFTNLDASMGGKWLELLKDVAPEVHDAAFLFNPTTASYANFYLPSFVSAGGCITGHRHPCSTCS